jgi:hypothetical protein
LWFFQSIDLFALFVGTWLLYQIFVLRRVSNIKNDDKCPVLVLIGLCFLLALALHADNNLRPIYDTFWMAGHNVSFVSVLPQRVVINRSGDSIAALTGHNIAVMTVERALVGCFAWLASDEILLDVTSE